MKTQEGITLINKMQETVAKSGVVTKDLVDDLKKLRLFAMEEEDPTLTRVIRLTFEHLEEYGTFNIPMPDDEKPEEEETEEEEEDTEGEDGEEAVAVAVVEEKPKAKEAPVSEDEKKESFGYLLSIMINRDNAVNKQDMIEYRDALKDYAG